VPVYSSNEELVLGRAFLYSRKALLFTLASIIFLLGACQIIYADDMTGSIEGTVIDTTNNGVISNSEITLLGETGQGLKLQTTSDLLGKFKFNNVPEGIYSLKISRLGYKIELIENVTVSAGVRKSMHIFLVPVEIEIEKINVTATKTETTLKQTPSSINIVSSDEIKNKNILTFDNVLQGVQGVTVFRTSGINVGALSIRGSSDVAGGGIGNRVLLLLDGRPSLTGDSKGALWSLIPTAIVERTEIVKGAFSSLYGSSAIGGVVNVITKKPTYKPFTGININYGFYERLSDSLKFSDKLLTFKGIDVYHSNTFKRLAYLLNLSYKQNDGHAQQTDYEFYTGVGKFMYDVFTNRDLEVTIQYTKSNSGYPHYWRKDAGKYAEPYKVAPYYLGDMIKKETQSYDVFYTALPSSTMKYTSRFYYYKLNSISYYNRDNPVSKQFSAPGTGLETFIKSYNFGNISQLDYEISRRNYLIAGTDIQWNVVRSNPEEILYGSQQVNNIGAFVQDQHKIIKDNSGGTILSSTAGVRFDYNKFVGWSRFIQVSPKVSLVYSPKITLPILENTSLRILAGRAFRAPSIAELYFKKELFGGFDFIFNPHLKPEVMYSAEIGVRKQYENRFTLDIAAYFNLYDNLIQYVNVGGGIYGPFQVQNIAKSQIKGLELLIDYNSSFNIFKKTFSYGFGFNYCFVDARDLSQNRKDPYLPYKPKHILNFSTDLSYFDFNLNVTGKYQSKVEEDLFYRYEEPDEFFLLDAKLTKRLLNHLTIFIAVNNVFNTTYQELERTQAPNRNFNTGVRIEF
jgi:iron complex outermembrane receptor protein